MNNEPAFPWLHPTTKEDFSGLTKRELIAAMMAQGMLAHGYHGNPSVHSQAVLHADALLAELKKEESK